MGTVEGKVAFVTGAGRGQGRSHAIRLAEEGADIIAVDICENIDSVPYSLSSQEDLDETARLVEKQGKRVVALKADVRDLSALTAAVDAGYREFGRLDIVAANAGIWSANTLWELTAEQWKDMIDVALTGVWHAVKASVPRMIEAGNGGSVVMTSSTGGAMGFENLGHYVAAKHAVVGLTRTLANEVGRHGIRANNIQPTAVNTNLLHHDQMRKLFNPDAADPEAVFAPGLQSLNILPVPWVEPVDISNALVWLSSDQARYITGVTLPVDAGFLQKIGAY
ncbi:mycofactocin-coupled SDR family oxidoreductase [Rhodococcus sp. USK10]|uniref:3-oxoacyl-[acyl-carrier protein] reductase n=1 Tax=Rhodococcus wratislaviensis TaxID=44752 RepID=A0A402CMP6_RHOWR|nr:MULTISPECIES: mycofactocin-coupled SDR family oxidoreductase [Rhodococcus]QYB01838.1 mycofactocin-coupled SDR family oxidoreductase [Rhodococcus sp. USK10]GCE44788.1 3-oxoacyl-[acyl-carrier protein] reductase [Rhodococcus wratislaviensis]